MVIESGIATASGSGWLVRVSNVGTNAERLALSTQGLPPGTVFWESDTQEAYEWTGSAWSLLQLSFKRSAGERQENNALGADHLAVAEEWKTAVINTNATGDVTVYPSPALVRSVRVRNTTNAGVATTNTAGIILVKDGTTVKDGAAAAKTPGQTIYDGLGGVQFRTSFILNFANVLDNPAADGKIEVAYRPLDTRVTW